MTYHTCLFLGESENSELVGEGAGPFCLGPRLPGFGTVPFIVLMFKSTCGMSNNMWLVLLFCLNDDLELLETRFYHHSSVKYC